jgi:hypothetical protein
MCHGDFKGGAEFLAEITWILGTAWEVLALSLAIWIAVKHFRALQRPSTGWAVRDYFTILMKTHVFYFARSGCNLDAIRKFPLNLHTSFVAVSCFELLRFSPYISVCY